jgi:hypothetical protein
MRIRDLFCGLVGCLAIAGCGSSASSPEAPGPTGKTAGAAEFAPPPPPPGYTRIVAPDVTGIEAGGDAIKCQYVLTPFDRDMDVLDISGYQSLGGHHSIAYAVNGAGAMEGTSRDCNAVDNTGIGGFLGGIGGESGGKATLPDGVVFRLKKGSTVMLNTHFLNTSGDAIDGHTVLDVKFAEAGPARKVASIFVNFTQKFAVAPEQRTQTDVSCTVPRDMKFLSFTNHMHSYGARSVTVLEHAADTVQVHEDPTWTHDMQFNPVFTNWTLDAPLTVKAGDTLKTHCEWENSSTATISFPDEMCVGFGFFLDDGSSSPSCIEGAWLEPTASPRRES